MVHYIFHTLCIFSLLFLAITISSAEEESTDNKDDIVIEILTPPPADCQRKTKKHDMLSMHYVGTLTESGKKFDSSLDRNQPFEFQLGTGQVIKGWDEGLTEMCVGEKRKLTIPPNKGYGKQGAGEMIPPDSKLTFEVELVNIKDGVAPPNVFKEIDTNGDRFISQDEVSDYLKKQAAKAGDKVQDNPQQHKEIITQIFNHEDKDKDGLISHEEFSGPKHDEL